jgi:hypothetical protein
MDTEHKREGETKAGCLLEIKMMDRAGEERLENVAGCFNKGSKAEGPNGAHGVRKGGKERTEKRQTCTGKEGG